MIQDAFVDLHQPSSWEEIPKLVLTGVLVTRKHQIDVVGNIPTREVLRDKPEWGSPRAASNKSSRPGVGETKSLPERSANEDLTRSPRKELRALAAYFEKESRDAVFVVVDEEGPVEKRV